MGCVLSIVGADLDVDAFVDNTGMSGFTKKHQGELRNRVSKEYMEYSVASMSITNDNWDDIKQQVKETEEFLIANK